MVWGHSDQPYSHTVQYDDGTTHSYCTLERPALTFDSQGLLTHINLAADLVTQDEGCASRGKGCVDVREGPHRGGRPSTLLPRPSSPSPPLLCTPLHAVQVQ